MKYFFLAILCLAVSAQAQQSQPPILRNIGIDQKLGVIVPGDLLFKNEYGADVHLGECFQDRPVVLALVYYQCPMLCTMVLNDLLRAMRSMPENVGKDYDVLVVSFDPRDTPELALLKKKTFLAQYNRPGAENGWHFLTGGQKSITALTDAVGFRYTWDPANQVFVHASGIIVLTPQRQISRYFFGIDYAPKDLRIALTEAQGNKIGSVVDEILLYCFCYDPTTGKYGLAISRMLKGGGILTVLTIGGLIGLSIHREKRRGRPA